MSRWAQPICERDWIAQRSTWDKRPNGEEHLVSIAQPHRLLTPPGEPMNVERCSYCGEPTIFGAFVRADPASVPFPPVAVGEHRTAIEAEAAAAALAGCEVHPIKRDEIRASEAVAVREAAAAASTALLDELEAAVKALPATMWPDFEGIDEEVPYVTFEGVRRTAVLHEITRRRRDPRG